MKKKWVEQINRDDFKVEDVTKNSRVCSRHFAEDKFIPEEEDKTQKGSQKLKRSLRPRAFPTLFLNPKITSSENLVQKTQKDLIESQAKEIERLKREL